MKHAVQVIQAGIDIVVAQGHDGGGHNSPIGTMALIPQVVDAVGDVPVLGAGGITDGRGIAAAMMLGAEGVWVGSAFLASNEAGIQDFQKQAIVDASEDDTVVSRSVTGKPARIIRSLWTDAWQRANKEPLPMPYQGAVSGPVMAAATRDKRGDINPGFAGQGIGLIKAVRPASGDLQRTGLGRRAGAEAQFELGVTMGGLIGRSRGMVGCAPHPEHGNRMSGLQRYIRTTLIGGVLVVLPLFVFANLLLWLATWIGGKTAPVAEFVAADLHLPIWVGQALTIGTILVACFALGAIVQHAVRQSRVQLARTQHRAARTGLSTGQGNRQLSRQARPESVCATGASSTSAAASV